ALPQPLPQIVWVCRRDVLVEPLLTVEPLSRVGDVLRIGVGHFSGEHNGGTGKGLRASNLPSCSVRLRGVPLVGFSRIELPPVQELGVVLDAFFFLYGRVGSGRGSVSHAVRNAVTTPVSHVIGIGV